MPYTAIICKITNIRDHTNADRLNVGNACGYNVIIGKDVEEGTIGVFFGDDGCLSEEMAKENNLYRHAHLNKDPEAPGGYLDDNRRIRTITLRGERSEGIWMELDRLSWTEIKIEELSLDFQFDELNGHKICEKYETRATRMAKEAGKGTRNKKGIKGLTLKDRFKDFKTHWEVDKLRKSIHVIPEGAILSISEKVHGTSGRTGYQKESIKLSKFKRIWNNIFGVKFPDHKYTYVSGSRKVTLDPNVKTNDGYYSGKRFRGDIHKEIKELGLHRGETLYYEIIGFDDGGGQIMPSHGIDKKDPALKPLYKKYGDKMNYFYGCNPESPNNKYKVLLYRITYTTSDGHITEAPFHILKYRAKELGMNIVPQLKDPFIYDGDRESLKNICEKLSQGSSTLDNNQIKEGVVVRVDSENYIGHLKYKSFFFCSLEGIAKNSNEYIDPEETS